MQVGCSTLPHANAPRSPAPCAVNYVITRPNYPPFPSRGKNERSNVRVRVMQERSNSPPFLLNSGPRFKLWILRSLLPNGCTMDKLQRMGQFWRWKLIFFLMKMITCFLSKDKSLSFAKYPSNYPLVKIA